MAPPATRTQIYLTDRQRARLDELCRRRGLSLAESVREAVDRYLETGPMPTDDALTATFGAIPDLAGPSRDEWDRDPDAGR